MAEVEELLRRLVASLAGPAKTQPEVAPDDPYAEITAANKHLRETAKWILTSFAAVGAILVAGLQLSSLGKLTSETPDARIVAALAGVAFAAIGVVLAIGFMSSVLAPLRTSFHTADKHQDVTERVLGDRELLRRTYPELKEKIAEKDAAVDEARKLGTSSADYKQARAEREAWEKNKQAALVYIGAELLWDRYKRARGAVIVSVFLIVGGVVAFAWGANPPSDETKSPSVVLGQAPLLLDVTLTPAGIAALKGKRTCERPRLRVLSIGGAPGDREVVTIPGKTCKSVRFLLTPAIGTATAAQQ